MTTAITARQDGDRFQARLFWLKAVELLDPETAIIKVGFETGPKAFDDIFIEYQPGRGPKDQFGVPTVLEHTQVKWHASGGQYGYAELVDPEFINAASVSLLQRAHNARQDFAQDEGVMLRFVSSWRAKEGDALQELIKRRDWTLRLDRLLEGGDRAKFGKVRKCWREHLGIDDEELTKVARLLRLTETIDSLDRQRELLDSAFRNAGLRRVPTHESSFIYDDLAFQLMAQGRQVFDRRSFREMCGSEGLLESARARSYSIGIKSFVHAFDTLEDRCSTVLDLTGDFDGRFIHMEEAWTNILFPKLRAFLVDAAATSRRIRLALDAHLSLAFAAGSVLNLKSGRTVELEQRTPAITIWAPDDPKLEGEWPTLEVKSVTLNEGKPDVAVALSITHAIEGAVINYINKHLSDVGTLLVCSLAGGGGRSAVRNGRHADEIADAASKAIYEEANGAQCHLFIAAPNAVSFFLGQRQMRVGPVTLYEHDFEGARDRSYRSSLKLP